MDSRPRMCFEVEKVIGVSSDGSYKVQWAPAWVSRFHLVGCEHLIQEFHRRETTTTTTDSTTTTVVKHEGGKSVEGNKVCNEAYAFWPHYYPTCLPVLIIFYVL